MENNYIKDLKQYLDKYKSFNKQSFDLYGRMYAMTTENIFGFLKNYDLKDKKILTVAGSGDQRLNAYLMGAQDVTCFDSNPKALLNMKLKDAAISKIDFKNFLDFFFITSHEFSNKYTPLDSRIFNELKKLLDKDTYSFFEYIINQQHCNFTDIYYKFIVDLELLKRMNAYLDEDNYSKLRDIIKDKPINFINCDLVDLPDKLNEEKFDMILLSNISDYTNKMYEKDDLVEYRKLIDKLVDNLNMFGIIQVGYIYSKYGGSFGYSSFNNDKIRHQYFPTDQFHTMVVDSYFEDNSKDKVITYQKLK